MIADNKSKRKMFLKIYDSLLKHFGKQYWWPTLSRNKKLEICVGAILTQNTAWKNVEKALRNLINENLLNLEALNKINQKKLESLIKSAGYYRQKAKKIKALIKFLITKKKPSRKNLLAIYGVGKETADSILLYAFNKPIFVVDAYTRRIFSRLGMLNENLSYDEIQEIFEANLPRDTELFKEYHALIVELGKNYCKKKSPSCEECPLNSICKFKQHSRSLLK